MLVIVLTAWKFDVDVTCHQLRTNRVTQDFQHHRQTLALSILEHILVLLRPCFGVIPAVADDNCAHVVGRCVLAASSTRYGSQAAVHVQHGIKQGLALLLVKLIRNLRNGSGQAGCRFQAHCPKFFDLFQCVIIHKTVGKHHDGLNELRHTVQTVAFEVVDGIQHRDSRFKQTHTLRVQLVFDHRQHSKRMVLCFRNLVVVNFKVLVWRIHANQVVQIILIITWDMQNVGDGLVSNAGVVNHIRHVRVWNIHQQGRFVRVVAVVPLVRKNNAVSLSALQHPLPEPPIKRILALILQGIGQAGDFLTVTCCRFRPHIRAGSAAHVTCVEAHALIGMVLYNAIGDFSVVLLCAMKDRLTAQVVVMQKANLVLVQQMNRL